MKKQLALAFGLLLIGVALVGCGKSTKPSSSLGGSTPGGNSLDAAQVNDTLAAHPELVNEALFADESPIAYDATPAGSFAAVRPFRWWRVITSDTRTVDVVFSDPDTSGRPTSALVTVHRHLLGDFDLLVPDTTKIDSTTHLPEFRLVKKPLDDAWERQLVLHRMVDPDSVADTASVHLGRHWRIVGTSGVVVTSLDATTQINSLRIQAGALDTTITDPLALRLRPRLMCLPSIAGATLTVTTGRNDDVVVLYRDGGLRRRFTNNGDNTYTITFPMYDFFGLRHFGVNALSNGTLFDDTAPYDSKAWLLPFAVHVRDCDVIRE